MRRRKTAQMSIAEQEALRKKQARQMRDNMLRERMHQAEKRVAHTKARWDELTMIDPLSIPAEHRKQHLESIDQREAAYRVAVKDLAELRKGEAIREVGKGVCPKCGVHIGRGVFMHMRNCNGVHANTA